MAEVLLRNFPSMGPFQRVLAMGIAKGGATEGWRLSDCFGSRLKGLLGWQSLAICLAAGYFCG